MSNVRLAIIKIISSLMYREVGFGKNGKREAEGF